MRLRSYALAALAPAMLWLHGCDDTPLVPHDEIDAGAIECLDGQIARNGKCYCQTDTACAQTEYCEAVSGLCKTKEVVTPPDASVRFCTSGARRCAKAPLKAVQECQNGSWIDVETCPEEGYCTASATGYYCAVCSPGKARCKGDDAMERCSEKGDQWLADACAPDPITGQPSKCVGDRCQICSPGDLRCSKDGRFLESCQADGSAWSKSYCPTTGKCEVAADGTPTCVAPFCTPNERKCLDAYVRQTCLEDGSAFKDEDCRTFDKFATPAGVCQTTAQNTDCYDPCGQAGRDSSYQGCEYWAAITSNSQLDAAMFKGGAVEGDQPSNISEFAVVVSNPNTIAVKVRVTRKVAGAEAVSPSNPPADAAGDISVAAGANQIIRLPWQAIAETGVAPYGYHVVSNLPISAYQFNPVVSKVSSGSDPYSYTNDASLLLPAHILSGSYVVLGQEHVTIAAGMTPTCKTNADCPGVGNSCSFLKLCTKAPVFPLPAFFAIVGTQDNTRVSIKFSANTTAAKNGGPIIAQKRNSSAVYTLNKYDLLQFWTDADATALQCMPAEDASFGDVCRYASDPTGTIIRSTDPADANVDRPVAVFSGADCTFKPFNHFACDHVEEMMVPFNTWGKSYAGAKSVVYKTSSGVPVTNPSPDYWRVVAGCGKSSCPNGTRFTIDPAPKAIIQPQYCTGNVCTLPPVDTTSASPTAPWLEFTHGGDFIVTSDQPVMLSQYFTGENANPNSNEGDPSLILTPPIEQWRNDYNILASPTLLHNYVSLVAQSATPGIQIDSKDVTPANFPGLQTAQIAGGYLVFRVPVTGGSHRITSRAKTGVTVYGYDRYVSYGYTGGLDLVKITQILPGG